jgi:Uncharacterized protein involved in exopolysaccharide biosynthesis
MSKDFELLRKVELGGLPTRRADRRELFSDVAAPAGDADLHRAVRPAEQTRLRESEWIKTFTVVRKRWRLITCFAAIVLGLAAVIVFWIKPEYEPSARLEIDPPGSETFSMQTATSSLSETQYLETQAQGLQTDDLAIAVIRKLGLDRNSEFAPNISADQPPRIRSG